MQGALVPRLFLMVLVAVGGCGQSQPVEDDPHVVESRSGRADDPSVSADAGLTAGQDMCAPANSETTLIQDVYFEDNPAFPWMTCYTTEPGTAAEMLRRGEVPGTTGVLLLDSVTVSGASIFATHRYDYWPDRRVEFRPCVFTKQDACTHDCVITFQDDEAPVSDNLAFTVARERRCSAEHPELAGRYVDCSNGLVHPVTNTWRQAIPRSELKLMQHILSLDGSGAFFDLVVPAIGGVGEAGGSLEACMEWSSPGLAFTFARTVQFPEVCDWAVTQMHPDFGTWCPWGIQVVKVACDGYPEIVNPRAQRSYPLDRNDPAVREFCGAGPAHPADDLLDGALRERRAPSSAMAPLLALAFDPAPR